MDSQIQPSDEHTPAPSLETDLPEREKVTESSFTPEELIAVLWLRRRYRSGGTDLLGIVEQEEFLEEIKASHDVYPYGRQWHFRVEFTVPSEECSHSRGA
jgi:hypothetical protein